jgi:hypothetical protein
MAVPFSWSLQELIKALDADMGVGFCKKHPNLLGRALIASELHFLADTLRSMEDTLRTDHPSVRKHIDRHGREDLGRIEEALNTHGSEREK